MVQEFEKLQESELDLMLKAPVLVCILIAGADGNIDRKEIKEAISVVGKSGKSFPILNTYCKEASADFEDKLKVLLQNYPSEVTRRNVLVVEELAGLNIILPKINKSFAAEFYAMLHKLAGRIAASSGGLLGYNAINSEEKRYLNLPMIQAPL